MLQQLPKCRAFWSKLLKANLYVLINEFNGLDPDSVESIVIEGWPNVPYIGSMWSPSFLEIGLFMDEDLGARWGKRSMIVVEGLM